MKKVVTVCPYCCLLYTSIIVIDPLVTPPAAKAALDLYFQHRPQKPIVAVIYTHSHACLLYTSRCV